MPRSLPIRGVTCGPTPPSRHHRPSRGPRPAAPPTKPLERISANNASARIEAAISCGFARLGGPAADRSSNIWTHPENQPRAWGVWASQFPNRAEPGTRIVRRGRYIEPVVICVGVYDMVARPRDLADRMAARRKPDDGYLRRPSPAARPGTNQGARFPQPLSQGRLHERGRKLARTARWRHRIHHAAAAQRGLASRAAAATGCRRGFKLT